MPEQPHARRLERARGRIVVPRRLVRLRRRPGRAPSDVAFAVEPGTRVGISGPTGAGKTTLVSLLTRFYDPTSGAILLDGVDLRDYRLADLRSQFAIVLQEPVLFSTSIAENIAYAAPGGEHEEIEAAARAANAHDFIAALPDGYDTLVGERGMRLSGGERQRISLARAFLKDAPILILDEPTSSVDVRDRGRDHGRDGAPDGGPDDVHDRPPALDARRVRRVARGRRRAASPSATRPPATAVAGEAAARAERRWPRPSLRIVVTGLIAQHPRLGGVTWDYLQYAARAQPARPRRLLPRGLGRVAVPRRRGRAGRATGSRTTARRTSTTSRA